MHIVRYLSLFLSLSLSLIHVKHTRLSQLSHFRFVHFIITQLRLNSVLNRVILTLNRAISLRAIICKTKVNVVTFVKQA